MAFRLPPLLLLLLLLLLVPATVWSAKCKFFSSKTEDDFLIDFKSKQEAELRVWSTMIAAQYSPAASKLIVLFRTPPSRDRLDQMKLEFDSACDLNPKSYRLVALNSTESVGKNLSLVTVDKAYLPTDTGSLCLNMEVFTYQNGDPVKPRVFSAMAGGCYVNLHAATAAPRPSNQSNLPSSLAQLLMHRYSLMSTDNCCLQYVGPATRMPPPLTATASQPLSPQLVTGLYVLVGALCLLCLLILAWLGHKLVVSVKNFKSACKARCRELALQRQLRFARPSVVRLEQLLPVDLAGPPYQHLLTHCKSVRTRQRIAGMRTNDAGRSNT